MPGAFDLVAAYGRRLDLIRTRTGRAILALWLARGGPDDDRAVLFTRQAAATVTAAQAATASLVEAYLAAFLGTQPVGLPATRVTGAAVRNGAQPEDVYHRVVVTARTALSNGKPYEQAMNEAGSRASSTAETDVALAHRAAAAEVMQADQRVVGYRRVLTGRSCMFCATASTQRYRVGQLLPIHAHCDCRVAPIVGDSDPGLVLNRDLLDDLRAQGGSQYWKARGLVEVDDDGQLIVATNDGPKPLEVAIREHGELGPVLVDGRHHFRSEDEAASDTSGAPATTVQEPAVARVIEPPAFDPVRFDDNTEAAAEYLDTSYAAWRQSLSDDERKAVENYAGNGFARINANLRGQNDPNAFGEERLVPDEQVADRIAALDAAFSRPDGVAPGDMVVYRAINGSAGDRLLEAHQQGNLVVPGEQASITDPAYMSTSLDPDRAVAGSNYGYRTTTKFEVRVRRGQRAIAPGELSGFHRRELEVILPRGTRLAILDAGMRDSETGPYLHIVAEVADGA